MCLDERGVSRSDLKPSQRCALRNSGGMFLVLASLRSPVSLFSPVSAPERKMLQDICE